MSANKNILLLIAYPSYTKHVRFYLTLPISVAVSIFIVSAFIFLTLIPNISILFTAIPQYIIISPIHCIEYTALLKTLHNNFCWDALPSQYDPNELINTLTFLDL